MGQSVGGGISKRSSLWAVLYCLMSILCAGIFVATIASYFSLKKIYIQTVFDRYSVILTSINDNIDAYIHSQMREMQSLVQSSELAQLLTQDAHHANLSVEFQQRISKISPRSIIFSDQRYPMYASDGNVSLYQNNAVLQESIQRSQI